MKSTRGRQNASAICNSESIASMFSDRMRCPASIESECSFRQKLESVLRSPVSTLKALIQNRSYTWMARGAGQERCLSLSEGPNWEDVEVEMFGSLTEPRDGSSMQWCQCRMIWGTVIRWVRSSVYGRQQHLNCARAIALMRSKRSGVKFDANSRR